MLYCVKTIAGREKIVLDALAAKAEAESLRIKALLHPAELKGYIFVEGELEDIEKAVRTTMHARSVLRKPVELKKLEKFLLPKKVELELKVGDIVEVIGGPFKGEKGKVVRFDKLKRECTLELLEVAVTIPTTVPADLVKIVKRAEG